MVDLGIIQKMEVTRKAPNGLYLNVKGNRGKDDVLLPKNQMPHDAEIGDEIEVFVYKDSEDRMISTTKKPKLTIGEMAVLSVVETTGIGAFLDWGLDKDLFLPFREQVGKVVKGGKYLVALYIDSSDRLCATMNIYNLLRTDSPYKVNDQTRGTIYSISKELGAFVAVDNKYQGLIPNKELYGNFSEGDNIVVRIKKVKPDGKLELSTRKEAYNEIESDAQIIMNRLKLSGGTLNINDSSSPELIKVELNMSKAAFKRAVGRLLKEGAIEITDEGIKMMW
ncbi:CvfB family protein [Pseudobacteroides cellulosolvens]|uniref:RNA binding S1 domain protein n=1 Tax=Pseudobacteroides cellulosolvens ATCC 35603 = DSM 2933 TaxID=398512 RepID=A0A0L6JVM6_9FIRM|nr:S1-like domain-containing RNA-binding protein [Pseudobacteroides cellulosolvens]KNY29883.1 RNA binding S1 domain protein [Pseudobacteroides cellulosolvens ATCC 35603 = DSM 2933]